MKLESLSPVHTPPPPSHPRARSTCRAAALSTAAESCHGCPREATGSERRTHLFLACWLPDTHGGKCPMPPAPGPKALSTTPDASVCLVTVVVTLPGRGRSTRGAPCHWPSPEVTQRDSWWLRVGLLSPRGPGRLGSLRAQLVSTPPPLQAPLSSRLQCLGEGLGSARSGVTAGHLTPHLCLGPWASSISTSTWSIADRDKCRTRWATNLP